MLPPYLGNNITTSRSPFFHLRRSKLPYPSKNNHRRDTDTYIHLRAVMPSLRNILAIGASLLQSQQPLHIETVPDVSLSRPQKLDSSYPTCPVDGPLSCHSTSAEPTCCFVAPGGQFLLTQFWDTNPSIGPVDSWTLHGLW